MSNKSTLPDAEQLAENISAQTELETAQAKAVAFAVNEALDSLQPRIEAFEVPSSRQFFRMGYVCSLFNQPPKLLREICQRADVSPVASIDDVAIYDGDGVLKISRYVKSIVEKYEGKGD